MLGLKKETAWEMIRAKKLMTLEIDGKFWIPREIFDDWYASQSWYRTEEDRARDKAEEAASITVPEMGRMLGLDRRDAWKLYYQNKAALKMIRIASRPRITIESFLSWLSSQDQYRLIKYEESEKKCEPQHDSAQHDIHEPKEFVPIQEAAAVMHISVQKVYRLLNQGTISGKKVGRSWYVRFEDILAMHQQKEDLYSIISSMLYGLFSHSFFSFL